jgi:hypothetical protein
MTVLEQSDQKAPPGLGTECKFWIAVLISFLHPISTPNILYKYLPPSPSEQAKRAEIPAFCL